MNIQLTSVWYTYKEQKAYILNNSVSYTFIQLGYNQTKPAITFRWDSVTGICNFARQTKTHL